MTPEYLINVCMREAVKTAVDNNINWTFLLNTLQKHFHLYLNNKKPLDEDDTEELKHWWTY